MRSSRRRLAAALWLAVALAAWPACAAVTLDAATTVVDTGTSTPTTVSHTTGASGSWMTVWTVSRIGGVAASVSTVTFGATSLAQRCTRLISGNAIRITVFDGTVPTSTTATVTVTWSGTNSSAVVAATSWNAVVGVGTCVTAETGSGTSITVDAGSVTTDLVADFMGHNNGGTTCTTGAGQTDNFTAFADGTFLKGQGSRETGGAVTTTMSWSACAATSGIIQAAYALHSVLPPALAAGTLPLLGVGR